MYVPTMTLTVVSYNFLSGAVTNGAVTGRVWCATSDADLVFAQECRPPRTCPGERYRLFTGDGWIWAPAGSARWGSAVLTRSTPIQPMPFPRYEGWIVGGELSGLSGADGRPVRGFSIHCPAGERGYVRTMHEILDVLVPTGGRCRSDPGRRLQRSDGLQASHRGSYDQPRGTRDSGAVVG